MAVAPSARPIVTSWHHESEEYGNVNGSNNGADTDAYREYSLWILFHTQDTVAIIKCQCPCYQHRSWAQSIEHHIIYIGEQNNVFPWNSEDIGIYDVEHSTNTPIQWGAQVLSKRTRLLKQGGTLVNTQQESPYAEMPWFSLKTAKQDAWTRSSLKFLFRKAM